MVPPSRSAKASLLSQKIRGRLLELIVDKFYDLKTQEAKSVVRTLHALHGLNIEGEVRQYLRSYEATYIPQAARNELLQLVGMWELYSNETSSSSSYQG